MDIQNTTPRVLRHKAILTILTGIGIGMTATIVFAVSGDGVLLIMGGILLLSCLLRGVMLWKDISSGKYKAISGICTEIIPVPFRRHKKVHLTLEDGKEAILLLEPQAKIRAGASYRFFFRDSPGVCPGSGYLDAALSSSAFLGFEELGGE